MLIAWLTGVINLTGYKCTSFRRLYAGEWNRNIFICWMEVCILSATDKQGWEQVRLLTPLNENTSATFIVIYLFATSFLNVELKRAFTDGLFVMHWILLDLQKGNNYFRESVLCVRVQLYIYCITSGNKIILSIIERTWESAVWRSHSGIYFVYILFMRHDCFSRCLKIVVSSARTFWASSN